MIHDKCPDAGDRYEQKRVNPCHPEHVNCLTKIAACWPHSLVRQSNGAIAISTACVQHSASPFNSRIQSGVKLPQQDPSGHSGEHSSDPSVPDMQVTSQKMSDLKYARSGNQEGCHFRVCEDFDCRSTCGALKTLAGFRKLFTATLAYGEA